MKRLAPMLATAALAAALTAGAGAQQQTFWTMQAKPSMRPTATAQPVPDYYYYYGCGGSNGGRQPGPHPSGRPITTAQHGGNPCVGNGHRPSPRPSVRPSPRPTR